MNGTPNAAKVAPTVATVLAISQPDVAPKFRPRRNLILNASMQPLVESTRLYLEIEYLRL